MATQAQQIEAPEVEFVCQPYNNTMYEWGRNCATLRYDEAKSRKAVEDNGDFQSDEDAEQFWLGYADGPRDNNTVLSLSLIEPILRDI